MASLAKKTASLLKKERPKKPHKDAIAVEVKPAKTGLYTIFTPIESDGKKFTTEIHWFQAVNPAGVTPTGPGKFWALYRPQEKFRWTILERI